MKTIPPGGTTVAVDGSMPGVPKGTRAVVRHASTSGNTPLVWLELPDPIEWSHGQSELPGYWASPAEFELVMRAWTVHQPWAWALVHGGKDVENRSRNIAGSYRGPVAVHAGLAKPEKHNMASLVHRAAHGGDVPTELVFGAVIGVVDMVSVHHDSDHGPGYPCSPWALAGDWHLMVENPRPLARPIPAKGSLGLWTPDAALASAIREQVPA